MVYIFKSGVFKFKFSIRQVLVSIVITWGWDIPSQAKKAPEPGVRKKIQKPSPERKA